MRYVESPNQYTMQAGEESVFLAGGITDCPDWQAEMVRMLQPTDLVLLNPRRKNFPIHDPDAARRQITWEHYHLRYASTILFWFPQETICPIVLFELGAWSMTDKPIFVGVHPQYKRRQDVEMQLGLVRPTANIVYSLSDLAWQLDCKYGLLIERSLSS